MGMMTRRNVKQRAVKKTASVFAEPKQDDFSQYMNPLEEVKSEKIVLNDGYTKTEINRMSTADLKKLAKGNGIDESLSGSEIKKALIDKFGL